MRLVWILVHNRVCLRAFISVSHAIRLSWTPQIHGSLGSLETLTDKMILCDCAYLILGTGAEFFKEGDEWDPLPFKLKRP